MLRHVAFIDAEQRARELLKSLKRVRRFALDRLFFFAHPLP